MLFFLVLHAALSLQTKTPARPEAPLLWATSSGTISYHLIHRLHAVEGINHHPEGRARLLPDGNLQVMVRARVDQFDSGNANRDAHMLEAVEAQRYPFVEIKGMAQHVVLPARFPATANIRLQGLLTFHGVSRPRNIEVHLRFSSKDQVQADASLEAGLGSHGIDPPSLMFVKVEDRLDCKVHLTFQRMSR